MWYSFVFQYASMDAEISDTTLQVRTRSSGPHLAKKETSVRRRYADFVWLRAALVERCSHALVPPLAGDENLRV